METNRLRWLRLALFTVLLAGLPVTDADAEAPLRPGDRAATSLERIARAAADGRVAPAEAVLLSLDAVVAPERLPEDFQAAGAGPNKCGTAAMVTAALARDTFEPAVTAQLAAVLARPSLPEFYDSPDGRFRIHYTTTGGSAVPTADLDFSGVPDFVEKIALYADSSWRLQVSQYGYLQPPSDGTVGGGTGLYDIYCQSIGAYGYTAPESPGPEPWNDYTSYIVVHNTFLGFPPNTDPDGNQAGAAKVTVAHEFQHACQFAYDVGEAISWMEQTATWMEDEVFDPVNDNYNYLGYFFPVPEVPLLYYDGAHEYASFVWPRWISEVHGAPTVHDIWSACIYTTAPTAVDQVLGGLGSSRDAAFTGFTVWNWITGSRDDGLHYEEGAYYPLVALMRLHTSYPVVGQTSVHPPGGLGSNYVEFAGTAGLTEEPLRIDFDGEDSRDWGASLVARRTDGVYEAYDLALDGQGAGHFTLPSFVDYAYAVLVPARLDITTVSADFTYSACLGPLPPAGLTPAGGEEAATPVTLSWDPVPGAVSYRLQLAGDETFASPTLDTVLADVAVSAPGLMQDSVYFWRVSVTDDCASSAFGDAASFRAVCAIAETGDVNLDAAVTAGDIVYLVNYVFKSGPEPQPSEPAGDVNCDGVVAASDIIYLVTYVYKGGAPPCDVCTIL